MGTSKVVAGIWADTATVISGSLNEELSFNVSDDTGESTSKES